MYMMPKTDWRNLFYISDPHFWTQILKENSVVVTRKILNLLSVGSTPPSPSKFQKMWRDSVVWLAHNPHKVVSPVQIWVSLPKFRWGVAQLVEYLTLNQKAEGPNPSSPAKYRIEVCEVIEELSTFL